MNLKEIKEALRIKAEFLPFSEAFEKGICIKCQKPPEWYSDSGRREYNISGLCEYCFDEIMKDPEEIQMTQENKEELIEELKRPITELSEQELEDAMQTDAEPEEDDDDDDDDKDES